MCYTFAITYGMLVECLWNTYGMLMECLWNAYDIYLR